MYPYIPHTPEDEKEMLDFIGLNSLEELFSEIPKEMKVDGLLNMPKAKSELEVTRHLTELANKNTTINDMACFLGAGAYDHYIPSIVDHVISRSEFYTSYTPYQPEVSQGTLQYIFEFQTLLCELTGMDIANASLYDGSTAVVEASLMAAAHTRKKEIIISKTTRPETIQVLKTYARCQGLEIVEVDMKDGVTDLEHLDKLVSDNTAAVVVQSPNFFGVIEDLKAAGEIVHKSKKAAFIASVDPISLGILKKPSELGVDIVVGEAQPMGMSLSYGGPYLGFITAKKDYMRKIPGRIVGETKDVDGKRSFVLTLTAREQHIRRAKATSNICSNQGLNTLAATVYMVTLGKQGLKEVAMQSAQKAHYAFEQITKSGKYKPVFDKPFFKEFAVASDIDPEKITNTLYEEGIMGGYHLGRNYDGHKDAILYAVTEKRTKDEIDTLSSVLEGIK